MDGNLPSSASEGWLCFISRHDIAYTSVRVCAAEFLCARFEWFPGSAELVCAFLGLYSGILQLKQALEVQKPTTGTSVTLRDHPCARTFGTVRRTCRTQTAFSLPRPSLTPQPSPQGWGWSVGTVYCAMGPRSAPVGRRTVRCARPEFAPRTAKLGAHQPRPHALIPNPLRHPTRLPYIHMCHGQYMPSLPLM